MPLPFFLSFFLPFLLMKHKGTKDEVDAEHLFECEALRAYAYTHYARTHARTQIEQTSAKRGGEGNQVKDKIHGNISPNKLAVVWKGVRPRCHVVGTDMIGPAQGTRSLARIRLAFLQESDTSVTGPGCPNLTCGRVSSLLYDGLLDLPTGGAVNLA